MKTSRLTPKSTYIWGGAILPSIPPGQRLGCEKERLGFSGNNPGPKKLPACREKQAGNSMLVFGVTRRRKPCRP